MHFKAHSGRVSAVIDGILNPCEQEGSLRSLSSDSGYAFEVNKDDEQPV